MSRIRVGHLEIGTAPRIVGTVASVAGLQRLVRLRNRSCDLVEVRADLMPEPPSVVLKHCAALRRTGMPVLLTVRSRREGGQWKADESSRRALYRRGLAVADAVDLEIQSRLFRSVAGEARRRKRAVIGSFHDFKGTPGSETLRQIVRRGRARGADIVKIATRIRRAGDLEKLEGLLLERDAAPLCLIGMGRQGPAARIRLARAGSCLVYGYLDRPVAPGQIPCHELARRLLRKRPDTARKM